MSENSPKLYDYSSDSSSEGQPVTSSDSSPSNSPVKTSMYATSNSRFSLVDEISVTPVVQQNQSAVSTEATTPPTSNTSSSTIQSVSSRQRNAARPSMRGGRWRQAVSRMENETGEQTNQHEHKKITQSESSSGSSTLPTPSTSQLRPITKRSLDSAVCSRGRLKRLARTIKDEPHKALQSSAAVPKGKPSGSDLVSTKPSQLSLSGKTSTPKPQADIINSTSSDSVEDDKNTFIADLQVILDFSTDLNSTTSGFPKFATLSMNAFTDYGAKIKQLETQFECHQKASEPKVSSVIEHLMGYYQQVQLACSVPLNLQLLSYYKRSLAGANFLENTLVTYIYQDTDLEAVIKAEADRRREAREEEPTE